MTNRDTKNIRDKTTIYDKTKLYLIKLFLNDESRMRLTNNAYV